MTAPNSPAFIAGGERSGLDGCATPYVDRTCTESAAGRATGDSARSGPLRDFRDASAYVLLGDPGAGKTTEFERESAALGEAAVFVSARDFITFDPADHPEWQNTTLFIDGLDEMRAGGGDGRLPLDEIRRRLDLLGRPKFRLSCREADWLGRSDRQALEAVAANGCVTVLRLEPLSHDAAEELLKHTGRVPDATRFQQEARGRGVDSMLDNPLTLQLLAAAVGREGWPDGRLELFESACQQLVGEWNDEHRAASRSAIAVPASAEPGTLVDAAGHLCALMLLAGRDGFTFEPPGPEMSFEPETRMASIISLAELREHPGVATRGAIHAALATGLFRAQGLADGGFVPLHRQVAEFLAGRHLAQLIKQGLPARRVVSLMVSLADVHVVTPLRGLAAWLAVHCPQARPLLIEADPVGTALYGDIRQFADDDKRRLLRELEALPAQEPVFDYERPNRPDGTLPVDEGWAFRALASAGMADPIRELLGLRGLEVPNERIELLVLRALAHAEESEREHLRVLLPELEERVTDDARPPAIRQSALDACQRLLADDERAEVLRAILEAIHEGAVSDPDDELRGTLLSALYPDAVGPSEVFRYLSPLRAGFYGRCRLFWRRRILERSSDDQVSELLDVLRTAVDAGHLRVSNSSLQRLHSKLLARGLQDWGDDLDNERLYRWLSIPVTDDLRFERNVFQRDAQDEVRSWLENHPTRQKAVFLASLKDRILGDKASTTLHTWGDLHVLHGSRLPADFGWWCLEQAVEHAEGEPALSEELLRYAYSSLQDPALNEGLTRDVMQNAVCDYDHLARRLEKLPETRSSVVGGARDPHLRQIEELHEQRDSEARQRQQEWAELVRSHEKEMQENFCPPRILHVLAGAYLGMYSESDNHSSPKGCLSEFLGGDLQAVEIAAAGLRGAVLRNDLPEADETTKWHLESQQPSLALPVLASLQILGEEQPNVLDDLDAASRRRVLAMYFWSPAFIRISTAWYRRWLQQDPDLVLDVLQRCALAAIRKGAELPDRLRAVKSDNSGAHHRLVDAVSLAHGISTVLVGGDGDAAHRLRLRVLQSFPTRAPKDRLPLIDGLLFETLNGPETGSLREVARKKLMSTSLTVGQRVRWLTVDAALSGAPGLRALKEFVEHNEIRARHLGEFLNRLSDYERFESKNRRSVAAMLSGGREPTTLAILIQMLGSHFPSEEPRSGLVSLGQEVSDRVAGLIAELGSIAGGETEQVLSRLIGDKRLAAWRHHLNRAQRRQRVLNRDAVYRHPSVEQVQNVLNNGAPANVADLHALLVEHLADTGSTIRGANSNLWRQFWNEDFRGRPETPKPEESCRDALLAFLRPQLPSGVDLQPEGRYAADARADIRASSKTFNVPIEVKKNNHRDLWRAIRSQLIPQYTIDPATSGYGIYLVLWFGDDKTVRALDASCPTTPEELRENLKGTLIPEEARKIEVVVLDVTKPAGTVATVERDSAERLAESVGASSPGVPVARVGAT